jgi:two-component system, chemotaxis family, chemotaxis protein CheY
MTKTLLIVDDAAVVRQRIRDIVVEADWEVVGEAANGSEAVRRYDELRPTAVTLDLVMPESDGIHALREILAIDPDAKVVVVSALGQKNILKDAFKLGAADFIVKPFDRQTLIHTLEQFAVCAEPAFS